MEPNIVIEEEELPFDEKTETTHTDADTTNYALARNAGDYDQEMLNNSMEFQCVRCCFSNNGHLYLFLFSISIQGDYDYSVGDSVCRFCPHCNPKKRKKRKLIHYIPAVELIEEKQYACGNCNKSFKSASVLSRHTKSRQCYNKVNEQPNGCTCVLHIDKTYDYTEKVIPFTEHTLERCHKKKEYRDACKKKRSKFDAIVLPTVVDAKLGYHSRCYKFFIA